MRFRCKRVRSLSFFSDVFSNLLVGYSLILFYFHLIWCWINYVILPFSDADFNCNCNFSGPTNIIRWAIYGLIFKWQLHVGALATTPAPIENKTTLKSLKDGLLSVTSPQNYKEAADFDINNDESTVSITVVGASGDLAKKKIFPALFALYYEGCLPKVLRTSHFL